LKKIISFSILLLLIFYSCHKSKENKDHTSSTAEQKDSVKNIKQNQEVKSKNGQPSDFISGDYDIQYETEGDLNQDGLSDIALVLRKKSDTFARRKMLILLRNTDKTYHLSTSSDTVIPEEYNEAGYKTHETEDISIDKNILNINLYDIGPYGNQFSKFKYIEGSLILTYIETYNMGAGSHSSLYYEPLKGKLTEETVNTMEENMPSKTRTFTVKKERYLFEKASPGDIIFKIYNSIEGN
jgi:hypothetical protein